jgi:hypothetical protein
MAADDLSDVKKAIATGKINQKFTEDHRGMR